MARAVRRPHQVLALELYANHIRPEVRRFDHKAFRTWAELELGADFSVEKLAAHLHLAPTFTRYLLRGTRQPSLETYLHILAEAELPLGTFIRGLSLGHPDPPPWPHN